MNTHMFIANADHLQILDAISQSAAILRGDIIVHANLGFAALCKTGRDGLRGLSLYDFVIPKHRKRVAAYLDNPRNAARAVEFTLRDIDGAESLLDMQAADLSLDGEPVLLCSLTDITQKVRMERKLIRILDSVPEVIMAFDREHRQIESVNNATEAIYGVPAEQFANNIFHPIDLVLQDDSARVREFYLTLVEMEFDRIEYRVVHANGDIRWVRDEGEVVYKEHGLGRIQQVYHFIRDITERKNNEEKMRTNEQKYRRIFESSMDPIYVASSEGAILDINRAGIALFGYADKEQALAGNTGRHFVDPADRTKLVAMIEETGSVSDYQARLRTLSGEIVDAAISAGCRRNRNTGRPETYQVIVHDMRPVIERTELETYRRTLGGLSDRVNNIVQDQVMQYGLMRDYIEALRLTPGGPRQEQLLRRLQAKVHDAEVSLSNLRTLGEKIRAIYHAPEPPVPVSDGTGGILFDLK